MEKNEYQCALCKGIFEKGRNDEEALTDFKETFPITEQNAEVLSAGISIVCEDCFIKMYGIPPKEVV